MMSMLSAFRAADMYAKGKVSIPRPHSTRKARYAADAELARHADASRRLVLKPRLADLAYALKEEPNAPCYSWAEAWD